MVALPGRPDAVTHYAAVAAAMATYAELEAISVDLSLFPECPFFQVTVRMLPVQLLSLQPHLGRQFCSRTQDLYTLPNVRRLC